MLQQSTLKFLQLLKKNNNREWFEKNRDKYESAKEDFVNFVGEMIRALAKINPVFGSLETKDCVFRIYRDVRFSKNKAPYKTNMGAYFVEGGKKSEKAGFYIQVEPGNSFIAGGCWMPQGPVLKRIRQEIDYNPGDFTKIIKSKSFRKYFDSLTDYRLKTTPKGYLPDNPVIDHLRQTSFVVVTSLTDKDVTSKLLVKKSIEVYKSMKPFLQFLNVAIG